MTNNKDKPVNLIIENYQLSGARNMLLRLRDSYKITSKEGSCKEKDVYIKADLDLISSSLDNTRRYLYYEDVIHYRNHKRDSRGKLISVEAYFT